MKNLALLLLACALLTACTPGGEPAQTTAPPETMAIPTATLPADTPATDVDTILAFSPNEALDGYIQTEVRGYHLSVTEALIRVGVLHDHVRVNEISWNLEENSIHVDFNAAFRDLICTQGTTGELMIMGSVVNTFLTANDAETMTITIDGEILESGHVIYDFPMGFYE